MPRVVIHRPGSYGQLRLEDAPTPTAGPGEVVVDVSAIGVNYADCIVRMGLYASAWKYEGWPITPGFEVAGRVAQLGVGVDDLAVGDEVIAVTRFGGYATSVRVPRRQVFRRPARLRPAEAAAVPAVFLTAYFALHELAHVREGMTVLVHSAAGGVGGAALQLGKLAGCRMVGVVGQSAKVETARALGADVVLDKSREDLWAAAKRASPRGYDVVLDANGVSTLAQSYAHLATPGRLVIYGFASMLPKTGHFPNPLRLAWDWLRTPRFNPLTLTGDNKSVLAFNLSYLFDETPLLEGAMGFLLRAFEEGTLRPLPVTTYPLARVAEAHRALESGGTVGKLVLTPS